MTELMTVEELSRYLRVTKRTIYRLIDKGAVPAVKVGRKWRFDREAVDNWLHAEKEEGKLRILVVDDDELITVLFRETLERMGHTVITAGDGLEGLKYVEQMNFDYIFLDLKLPEMDGAELFRHIRNIRPTVPVTIITGYPDSDIMARALEQGPFGVMNKPFDVSDITTVVEQLTKKAHRKHGSSLK